MFEYVISKKNVFIKRTQSQGTPRYEGYPVFLNAALVRSGEIFVTVDVFYCYFSFKVSFCIFFI